MIVREDMILGHESAGEVLAVGANVTTIKPGQRVAIEPGVPCAACKHCVGGRYNVRSPILRLIPSSEHEMLQLCPEVKFAATPPTDGTLRRYMAHPAKYLFPIPDHMTYAQAALVEPFSVALAAVDKCNPRVGQPVFIAGAGPVGLATALCVRAAGASPLVISDLEESRLEQARRLGFNALKIELNWTRDEVAHKIREAMGERCAPEIVFECTGAQTSIQSAIYVSFFAADRRPKRLTPIVGCRGRWHRCPGRLQQTGCRDPVRRDGLPRSQHRHHLVSIHYDISAHRG